MKMQYPVAAILASSYLVMGSAQATVIDISQNLSYPSGTGFNVFEQTLNLPMGFSNALINIASVYANDAAVLQVNGVNIVGWGIFGPGPGSFAFDASGPFTPFNFALGHGFSLLAVDQSYMAPFVEGNNTIKLFHNDNGAGIFGSSFSVANGEVQFNANVSYDTAIVAPPPIPTPEPDNLLLSLVAFGGLVLRRRSQLLS